MFASRILLTISLLGAPASARAAVASPSVVPEAGEPARWAVGASIDYGLGDLPYRYRGVSDQFVKLPGFGVTLSVARRIPLDPSFVFVPRASLAYRAAAGDASSYGMGGSVPNGSVNLYTFRLDAPLRLQSAHFFVGLGPFVGVVLVRADVGTGTSRGNAGANLLAAGGILEMGGRFGADWELGVAIDAAATPPVGDTDIGGFLGLHAVATRAF